MHDQQAPELAGDREPPQAARAAGDAEHEPDPGAVARSRALVEAEAAAPVPLAAAARQLAAAATAAIRDRAQLPALAAALRQTAASLSATARDPDRPKIAAQCIAMADALAAREGADDATLADAIVDPALRASEACDSLVRLAPHMTDDAELQRALDPLRSAIGTLRSFALDKMPPRYQTDLGELRMACDKLQNKLHRLDLDGRLMYGGDKVGGELFEHFDRLYRALEHAEPEVPAARGLIDALLALEAAIESGRKPNAFATAAKPKLDGFLDGLHGILARGPYGETRALTDIRYPLTRMLGGIELVGTVVGGASRSEAQAYASRKDQPEDPAKTADLHARHQPPPPDTREPAPAWVHPLEEAAKGWLAMMRSHAHPRMSNPSAEIVEQKTKALRAELERVIDRFPSAQQLAWGITSVAENLRFRDEQLEMGMSRATAEAESARLALWAELQRFALAAPGGADFEQNLTLQWLTAIDDEIASGIGWGYRLTAAGAAAGATHDKQIDRSIAEWNTPDEPEPEPIRLEPAAKQLLEAARAVTNPEAIPALIAALRSASIALATTSRDPSRKKLAPLCTTIATALEQARDGTPDEQRAKLADAILDPALEAYAEMAQLETLAPHLDDGDPNRALPPLREAFNVLRNFAGDHAPPRFTTDVMALRTAADQLFGKVQRAALSGELEYAYDGLFEPFDRLYRALEQAEPEIPEARALIDALLALEAAITSGRKPRAYAVAAEAPLKAFLDGLHAVLARGPFGSLRMTFEISSPLTRMLGFIEEVGTVLGGVSRERARDYEVRPDRVEDPAQTAELVARHAPPPPDTRVPAPDWCPPLEAAASKWQAAMKRSLASGRRVDTESKALRDQLHAIMNVLPASQVLGWRIADFEIIGLPNWQLGFADDVADAEAARKAWWAEARTFALHQPGGADRDRNLTLDWLMAIDRAIAEGLGYAYQLTDAGKQAAATHAKPATRTIDELNQPDEPPPA